MCIQKCKSSKIHPSPPWIAVNFFSGFGGWFLSLSTRWVKLNCLQLLITEMS